MAFLNLHKRTFVVFGVATRRSVAYHIGRVLEDNGARVVYSVQDEHVREKTRPLIGHAPVITCDVTRSQDLSELPERVSEYCAQGCVHGIVHSVAYANYERGFSSFLEVGREDFLHAMDVSCYSLIGICRALQPVLSEDASVVTVSVSTTSMAAQNYGYMAPVKAALNSTVVFLANSLGKNTYRRVNAVGAGLLKTSSSAGIPGYADAYMYAENVVPRAENLKTEEVAHTAAFLLSPASSAINGQTVVADAGMSTNYFDPAIVQAVVRADRNDTKPENGH